MEAYKYKLKGRLAYIGGNSCLLFILVLLLFPHFVMLTTSLKTLPEAYEQKWLPSSPRFSNFVDVWKAIPLASYLKNSLIITAGTVGLILLLGLPASYATSRMRFRGRKGFLYLAISLQMFGSEIIIVGIFKVMLAYGLVNTYLSLILTNATFNLPIAIWIFHNYLQTVPRDLDESAQVDGATPFQILTRIILPVLMPSVVVVVVISFLNTWNEFLVALVMISDPLKRPITVGLQGFIGLWQTKWNFLMLSALISTVPAVILMGFGFRQMKGGLLLGGIKM